MTLHYCDNFIIVQEIAMAQPPLPAPSTMPPLNPPRARPHDWPRFVAPPLVKSQLPLRLA